MTKSMGKGTVQIMIARSVVILSGYALHFGVGRHLGPELYGIIGVIFSLLALTQVIFRAGINRAVSKLTAENNELANTIKNKALKIILPLAGAVFIFYFIFADFIANLLNDPSLVPYMRLSAFEIPLTAAYVVYRASLNGMRAFGKLSKIVIIYSITKVFSVLILILLGFSISGVIIGYIIASFVAMLFARNYCKFISVNNDFDIRKIFSFAIPVLFFSLASTLILNIDLLSIKSILKENTLTGYYTSASTLARPTLSIFTALSTTLFPSIVLAYSKEDKKQVINYINQSLRYLLILLLPLLFLVSATSENLISMVYTDKYAPAAPALSILVFGLGFITLYGVLNTIIMAIGRPKVSMYIAFSLVPIDLILNLTLIPLYQLEGAAIATTVTAVIGVVISAAYIFKKFKTLVSPLSFVRILIGSIFIYFISAKYTLTGIFLPFEYIILFLVYLSFLWIVGEIKGKDIETVRGIIT